LPKLFPKTPGSLISKNATIGLPKIPYNLEQKISPLNNMTLVLAIASAYNYSEIAKNLRDYQINNSTNNPPDKRKFREAESLTILGIYGHKELMFEIVCDSESRDLFLTNIQNRRILESNSLEIIPVTRVAKLNGCEISRFSPTSSAKSIISDVELELDNGKQRLRDAKSDLKYKIISFPKVRNNSNLLEVQNMPVIIAYIFIAITDDQLSQLNLQEKGNILRKIYDEYRILAKQKPHSSGIYSLFLTDNYVIIKSIFLVNDYYGFMKFTKTIEQEIRALNRSDILCVHTFMGAEIIQWM
jgi:hypothetical protein